MNSAVLGVKNSLTGQHWVARDASADDISAIVRTGCVNEVVARLLAGRGVAPENVLFYLSPTFKDHLPDPLILKDADKASARIAKAVMGGEKIGIFGDYDVDGATSTSLIYQFLHAVGATDITARIPEREEGYGPTPEAMRDFIADGVKLIVTVDCGTSAFAALEATTGTDVIVIDHHEPDVVMPKICALVNPKRLDEPMDHPCRSMAAVGVVFMVLIAVNRVLREKGWYTSHTEPDLRRWLDLVALGTVCDVMQLRGLNRLFVKTGLTCMARGENKGLAVLKELAGVKDDISAFNLGFQIGPRLNACGRIGKAGLGMQLLCAKDEDEAREIAQRLDELNAVRRQMCEEMYKQAIGQVESISEPQTLAFVYGKDWHAGVIGIIAGRLKEHYKVPALVMSGASGEEAHGSGRSIAGYDLGAAILAAKEKGILTAGGGHAMAAGFSLKTDKLDEFKDFLCDYFATHKSDEAPEADFLIDSVVDIGAVNMDLAQKINAMEPFGEGNPEPRFAMPDVAVASVRVVGTGHVSCSFVGRNGRSRLNAIAFKAADNAVGTSLLNHRGCLFHVAGYLRLNTYRGTTSVQFIIEDLAEAS